MSAYNKLAGTSSAVSPLLKSLVIGEWGFDGTLCTDAWGPQIAGQRPDGLRQPARGDGGDHQGRDRADPAGPGGHASDGDDAPYSGGMITRGRHRRRLAREPARPLSPRRLRSAVARAATRASPATETPWNTARVQGARAGRRAQDGRAAEERGEHAAARPKTGFTNVAVVGPRADSVLRDWYGGLAPYKITGRQGIATKLGHAV